MERTGHPAAGVAGQPSEVESKLLRGLVDYLRQKRPELREEWASRITDAQLLRVMRADEIFSEVTAVYDNYVNALETGSVEALRAYARDLSERIVRRGVETDEVLGTVLLLRDVLARALFVRHQGDPELLGRVLDVYEPAANRIAVTVGVSFVEERERVIREQQAAIRERAEMLHRLSTFLADASLALDAPGSLEEILQLVAEHARELVAAERCRAEIRLPDGITIDAHAEAEPGTEPVSVPPADVAALYAAVAPGRRSLRMSSAELAAEPARRALEGGGRPGALDAQLARGVPLRSRRQGGRADPGVRQARRRIHPPRRGGAGATRPEPRTLSDKGSRAGLSRSLRITIRCIAPHVFVIRGDSTKLACDHWLLPTDRGFTVEQHWHDAIGTPSHVRAEMHRWRSAENGRVLKFAELEVGSADAQPWLVDVGSVQGEEASWFATGVRQFLDLVCDEASAGAALFDRERPCLSRSRSSEPERAVRRRSRERCSRS